MNKVLITGCAGFIGSHLTDRLLKEGYYVIGIDNLNNQYNPLWKLMSIKNSLKNDYFKFFKEDILDSTRLNNIINKHSPSIIIHLAARSNARVSFLHPQLYEEVNVKGTQNILESARKHKIKKIIFGSSSSVYGNQSKVPFSESDPANNPISPYAATKKAGEILCHTYSFLYKIPIICLRFFTVYGPRGRPDMAPYLFTEAILRKKVITKYGDGSTSRDYTYINDIINGIISALNYRCNFEIFNLGNGHPVTLNELITTLESITKNKAKIISCLQSEEDINITCADLIKSKKYLKYYPKINLNKGLKRFIKWFKANRL